MKKILGVLVTVIMLCTGMVNAESPILPSTVEGATTVTAADLLELMEEHEDLVLVDSRLSAGYKSGYIEGAINYSDIDLTPEKLAEIAPAKETPIVFYCTGIRCHRSPASAALAVKEGYTKVYYYHVGLKEWIIEGLPLTVAE